MGLDTYLSSALTCKVSSVFHGKLLKLRYARVPDRYSSTKIVTVSYLVQYVQNLSIFTKYS